MKPDGPFGATATCSYNSIVPMPPPRPGHVAA
ncbi:hypothetical protein ACVLV4_001706 [Rathayibacter agropyri]